MKQYTYPAVFYYDEQCDDYAVEFSDICIYAEGETIEDAYKNAQDYLVAYLDCCSDLGVAPNPPNTYKDVLKSHPNGKIMLVTVDYEDKKRRNAEAPAKKPQESFTNVNDSIVESIESNFNEDEETIIKNIMRSQNAPLQKTSHQNSGDDDGDDDFSLPEVN